MTRALEIALWLALYAMLMLFALPVRSEVIQCGSDTVTVEPHGAGVALTYSNSVRRHSGKCSHVEIEAAGVMIAFSVQINEGANMSERFTVMAPVGWGAVPEEIDLEDGQTGKVLVMPWLF